MNLIVSLITNLYILTVYDVKHIDKLIINEHSNYSVHILSHKEKRIYFTKETEEVRVMSKI